MPKEIPEHREIHNEAAWEQYMEAERRELELRRRGHLRKLLGKPLPDEMVEGLERLASEDEASAQEGLVVLMDPEGEFYYKHIDELGPKDRQARMRAEGARVEWLAERSRGRTLPY